ncbi:MAG: [FeFe] hydrogenase H-cluster maturation GTPase HydF [Syntrophomonas sp.]|uniref:[FeFe] hydrogenase H-cluster maturation GTPase HydF n=1 Tax=Syntrophomonas sp. TaxID=2053627 RepID=UPI002618A8F9|nr:[FeFe] hydrogenase H-cluster maturation GTPase HydF [Syntrophomonas sp.]MDD2511281.1 [FeFe] hydrogenase H-cluster maturation GTPase HydF [Syntrophomonas sp.]MDD3880045.1 [FeFe] hydrogenase H-cluster maturation GTPase HydF [Syntrophomonas sp.]MDD4627533.1 [FeFe] hydrogenase H-cluster maturation GTPase HydF [Syntrophomonas sp.]
MQDTPKANRLHIAILGRRNAGKSSLINALTQQEIALVSEVAGTTTDPVFKAMEILPIGPCMIIDTAGIDDEGQLGELRIKKSREVLNQTDLALLVIDPALGISEYELELKQEIQSRKIALIGVLNKIDQGKFDKKSLEKQLGLSLVAVSSLSREGIELLKERIIERAPTHFEEAHIVGDLIEPGDICLLVVPIDLAAPKGRLILPQVQTIRDLLESDATVMVVKENQLRQALEGLKKKPRLLITDSQVFGKVAPQTPDEVMLTSFSILFARFKGDLLELVRGAKAIEKLRPGDQVLIAEACTHHAQDDDIGRVQIPRWLNRYVGGELDFHWYSGSGYPENLEQFKLVVHCGACMINRRQMLHRIDLARESGVPIVNYGVLLAFVNGILERTLQPFPQARAVLKEEQA